MKKRLSIILIVVFVLLFSLGVAAEQNLQEVKASIDYNMKLFLHGQPFNPVDVNGKACRPIIYDGKVYLPAKELCDAAGLTTIYDDKNNAYYLGEKLEYVPIDALQVVSQFGEPIYLTKDMDILYTPQKIYSWGLTTTKEFAPYWTFEILTNNRYSKFKGLIYSSDKNKTETIEIHADKVDGELLKVLKVEAGKTIEFEINVQGVNSLYITKGQTGSKGRIIIGEPQFK